MQAGCSSSCSNDFPTPTEEDRDSGICSMRFVSDCLASCLSSAGANIGGETELAELATPATDNVHPFLRRSLFPNMPQTVAFYTKGHKVRKPSGKQAAKLTWCHNSLLPTVIRSSLAASHFKIVDESKPWIGYWGRHLKSSQYKKLKPTQKVNHFPGAFHLGRKDRLWQHLREMEEEWGNGDFSIMPYTFVLPREAKRLKSHLSNQTITRRIILKPPASARGTGISIVAKYSAVPTKTPLVAQEYVDNPLLIDGNKFDLRLYVYVTSLDPLRIYLYDEGLVRFASMPYCTSTASLSNQYIHLTNYSINKTANNSNNKKNHDGGVPKWRLSEFWTYLERQGHDWHKLKEDIEDVAVKAIIACESHIREHAKHHSDHPFISHELFGMDVLVDSHLRPWLIEVNISPSLHSATALDVGVKAPLARDVLNMCGIRFPLHDTSAEFFSSAEYRTKHFHCHHSAAHREKERRQLECYARNEEVEVDILDELSDADLRCLVEFEDEVERRSGFRLVYPLGDSTAHYLAYMRPPVSYFNLLLHEWQRWQHSSESDDNGGGGRRHKGREVLTKYCANKLHFAETACIGDGEDLLENGEDVGEEENLEDSEAPLTSPQNPV